MSKKAPVSGNVAVNDSRHSFPLQMPGFVLTKEIKLFARHAIVIEIKDEDFERNGRSYQDLRIGPENLRGAARATLMQLWLFTLWVLNYRVSKNPKEFGEYPVRVFLEALSSLDEATGEIKLTNGHRLWIFVHPSSNVEVLLSIFKEAINSDKIVDMNGQLIDTPKNHGDSDGDEPGPQGAGGGTSIVPSIMPGAAIVHNPRAQGKPAAANERSQTTAGPPKIPELFKRVVDGASLAAIIDGITGRVHNMMQVKSMSVEAIDVLGPSSIERVFKRTSKTVNPAQRLVGRYMGNADVHDESVHEYTMAFYDNTMEVFPKMFRPEWFFTRNLPWHEINKKNSNWMRFMNEAVQTVNQRRAVAAARPLEDARDTDNDVAPVRVNKTSPTTDDELRKMVSQRPTRLTDVQLNDMMRQYGLVYEKEAPMELNDYVASLQHSFSIQEAVIRECYAADTARVETLIETLVDQMLDKFEATCMHSNSDVSKAQKALNLDYWAQEMDNKHMHVPTADPSKTAFENFLIFLEAGFTVHGGVATSQHIAVMGYLLLGDRFRRDLDLHENFLLCGPNASGKSHLHTIFMRCAGKASCVRANSATEQADAYTHEDTDVIRFEDDISASVENDPKNQARSAAAKSHFTTMQTSRSVLKLEPKRHMEVETGTEIRLRYAGTNDSIFTVMAGAGDYRRSTLAWWNRWICVELPYYENSIYNIGERSEAEDARTKAEKDASDDFFLGLQKAHTVIGWVHKLMSISPHIVRLDMTLFNIIWNRLTSGMMRHGLRASHPRIRLQAERLCRQIVLMEQYVMFNCMERSPFYGKPFRIHQVKAWSPVCYEHHVIMTVSFFFYDFYPPVMTPVIDVLRKLGDDAIAGIGDQRISVPGIARARADARQREEQAREEEARVAAERAAEDRRRQEEDAKRMRMEMLWKHLSKENGGGSAESRNAAILEASLHGLASNSTNVPPPPPQRRQQPAAAPQAAAPPPPVNPNLDLFGGTQGGAGAGPAPTSTALALPGVDCGMVEFKMRLQELAEIVAMRLAQMKARVKWEVDAITTALVRMSKMTVEHRKWGLRGLDDEAGPVMLDPRHKVKSTFLVSQGGTRISVPYGALREDHDDLRVFKLVLKAYCSKHTLPRDIVLAIDHPRYPWIYQSAHMVRGKHDLKVRNPRFVNPAHRARFGREQSDGNVSMNWIVDTEINTMAALRYFAKMIDTGRMKTEHVLCLTPEAMVRDQMEHAKRVMALLDKDAPSPFINYPRDTEVAFTLQEVVMSRMAQEEDETLYESLGETPGDAAETALIKDVQFDANGNPIISDAELDRVLISARPGPPPSEEEYNRPRVRPFFANSTIFEEAVMSCVQNKSAAAEDFPATIDAPENAAAIKSHMQQNKRIRLDTDALTRCKRVTEPTEREEIKARMDKAIADQMAVLEALRRARDSMVEDYAVLGNTAEYAEERAEENFQQQVATAVRESRKRGGGELFDDDDDDDDDDDGGSNVPQQRARITEVSQQQQEEDDDDDDDDDGDDDGGEEEDQDDDDDDDDGSGVGPSHMPSRKELRKMKQDVDDMLANVEF